MQLKSNYHFFDSLISFKNLLIVYTKEWRKTNKKTSCCDEADAGLELPRKKYPQIDGWKTPLFWRRRLSPSYCCRWWHCSVVCRRRGCCHLHEMLGHSLSGGCDAAEATCHLLLLLQHSCGLKEKVAMEVVRLYFGKCKAHLCLVLPRTMVYIGSSCIVNHFLSQAINFVCMLVPLDSSNYSYF